MSERPSFFRTQWGAAVSICCEKIREIQIREEKGGSSAHRVTGDRSLVAFQRFFSYPEGGSVIWG